MKTKSSGLMVLLLSVSLVFQQCTIEKRRYTGGFHVEWHSASRLQGDPMEPSHKESDELALISVQSEVCDTVNAVPPVPDIECVSQISQDKHEFASRDLKIKKPAKKKPASASAYERSRKDSSKSFTSNVEAESKAADASLGLSRVSLVSSVGWVLVLTQQFNAIAIGATLLGLGSACAILAVILAWIAIRKYKEQNGNEEDLQKAKRGIRNAVLFGIIGFAGLIGCAFVFGWL